MATKIFSEPTEILPILDQYPKDGLWFPGSQLWY